MAIPPRQNSVSKYASCIFNLAFFWAATYLEHRLDLLEPPGEGYYTPTFVEWPCFPIHEVFVSTCSWIPWLFPRLELPDQPPLLFLIWANATVTAAETAAWNAAESISGGGGGGSGVVVVFLQVNIKNADKIVSIELLYNLEHKFGDSLTW